MSKNSISRFIGEDLSQLTLITMWYVIRSSSCTDGQLNVLHLPRKYTIHTKEKQTSTCWTV